MATYFVSTKHALALHDVIVLPGKKIPGDVLAKIKAEMLDRLIASKAIFSPYVPNTITPTAEAVSGEPAEGGSSPGESSEKAISIESKIEDAPPALPPRPRRLWSQDPAKLAGKTKEQLTIAAREVDPKIPEFANAADGVRFLSQNFGK